MSRISDQIRAYVDDPDVAERYGAWGALRPDQRRLIRNLCDTCDMYEKTADLMAKDRYQLHPDGRVELIPRTDINSIKAGVIDEFVKRLKEAPIRCAYPLFGLSTKAEIEIHFNDIMLQVGDAIDSIAKEMKGGE